MKILVTYMSRTGNTKKIAEAIFNSLTGEKILKSFDEVETPDDFDLIFTGFPVMQFGPPLTARKFLASLAPGKKIALFVTHAIPTDGNDPAQQAMLEKELLKCRALCTSNELLGFFHCQGELSEKTAKELMASNIPMLMKFASMQPSTKGHPDPEELQMAGDFAKRLIMPHRTG